jgi:hypothetical protein
MIITNYKYNNCWQLDVQSYIYISESAQSIGSLPRLAYCNPTGVQLALVENFRTHVNGEEDKHPNTQKKNPAYGRHQLSRPMRIVGPIKFWRGCVIYRSAPKIGLGPRENADSVHAKVGTRSTQKCWLGSLQNTSPFLGLYSRSGSSSGTHPRF